MFPAFSSYAARPFASIVQIYGALNPHSVATPCNPKDICTCLTGTGGAKLGSNSSGGGNVTLTGDQKIITSTIDISFVQFAISSILNVKSLTITQLDNIIQQIVQKQLTYANYSSILNSISTATVLNDPYFFFIFYSYTIADYQYVQLQLKMNLENLQNKYIIAMTTHANMSGTTYNTQNVGLTINTGIKMEYIYYIQYYGLPSDGIFFPTILERIKYGIINETNYHFFTPGSDLWTNTGLNQTINITINDCVGIGTTSTIVGIGTTTLSGNGFVGHPPIRIELNTFDNKDIEILIL
jgi:hypothetical protein